MNKRIEALEKLARETVGDGKGPNLFFVGTTDGIELVTTDAQVAYAHWCKLRDTLHRSRGPALEDRVHGLVASVEIDENTGGRIVIDDFARFILNK